MTVVVGRRTQPASKARGVVRMSVRPIDRARLHRALNLAAHSHKDDMSCVRLVASGRGDRSAVLCSLFLCCVASGSCKDEPVPCDCAPVVETAEIVPHTVYAPPDMEFELQLRLKTPAGQVIPEGYTPTPAWSVNDAERLRVERVAGHSAIVKTLGPPPDTDVRVELTVVLHRGSSITAKGTVIVTSGGSPTDDKVRASVDAAMPPCAALVSGQGSAMLDYHPIAFVGEVSLGEMTGTGRIQTFCAGREAVDADADFSSPSSPNYAMDATGQPKDLEVPLVLWVPDYTVIHDWAPADVWNLALNDRAYANEVLKRNRTGLKLGDPRAEHYDIGTTVSEDCLGERPTPVGGALNMYYVAGEPEDSAAGENCGGGTLLVSIANAMSGTAIHEIGHALGIEHAGEVGIEDLTDNVMAIRLNSTYLQRSRLTLGQVYRMNWDRSSWLLSTTGTRADWTPRNCLPAGRNDGCPSSNHHFP